MRHEGTTTGLAQWWVHGVNAVDRARPLALGARHEEWTAAVAAFILRRAQAWLKRMRADGEPQTAEEVLAYARRIERDMPSLAADLRAAALRHETPTA
jgi:hypothetical protein